MGAVRGPAILGLLPVATPLGQDLGHASLCGRKTVPQPRRSADGRERTCRRARSRAADTPSGP
jgi:hypothetical protein